MTPAQDSKPRRDGWVEHRATWDEVTVGTVLADPNSRTRRWEVIATAHGASVKYGYTLWFRVRDQGTGQEMSLEPHLKVDYVTVLSQDPTLTRTPPPTDPTDTEAIMLIVKELDADILARRDAVTGEVVCPNYNIGANHLAMQGGTPRDSFIHHLRIAHNLTIPDDMPLVDRVNLHSQAHDPRWPNIGKGGFPHRHVPEDLSQF